ncbi:MAG: MamI family restriction endonuclease [Pseudomonadota bacterium]
MRPNSKYITIGDNLDNTIKMLDDLVFRPRLKALEWSKLTKQTPNMKVGYPGQHLASLITGVEGSRTGARGDDLVDGTEVKSCSRVDQLDICRYCKEKVLRSETHCPKCDSDKITRKNDSKWLFGIKSESELDLLVNKVDRIFLTIAEYPFYDKHRFDCISFKAYEIWNNCERHDKFREIMTNYYNKIFLSHIERNPNKTPAPKNFWPYSFQFYLCNPVKVFEATIKDTNKEPKISVDFLYPPGADRSELSPELMPISLLTIDELRFLISNNDNLERLEPLVREGFSISDFVNTIKDRPTDKKRIGDIIPYLDESSRSCLSLRDTDKISEARTPYNRR